MSQLERISDHVMTVAQGPASPWTTDEEAEQYAADPKTYILKRCKSFMGSIKMATNNIIVASYFLPQFTTIKGKDGPVNFYVGDKTTDEALYQGRVGLLIAKGTLAWKGNESDPRFAFGGTNYDIGDWVCFDRGGRQQISINRVHCRVMKDVDVWGGTDDPYRMY